MIEPIILLQNSNDGLAHSSSLQEFRDALPYHDVVRARCRCDKIKIRLRFKVKSGLDRLLSFSWSVVIGRSDEFNFPTANAG